MITNTLKNCLGPAPASAAPYCGQGQSTSNPAGYGWGNTSPWPQYGAAEAGAGPRQFFNVFVIIDLRRTGRERLGLVSDYVTMLALSQPRSLGNTLQLPSDRGCDRASIVT